MSDNRFVSVLSAGETYTGNCVTCCLVPPARERVFGRMKADCRGEPRLGFQLVIAENATQAACVRVKFEAPLCVGVWLLDAT